MPRGTRQTGGHVRENRNVLTEPDEETALLCHVHAGAIWKALSTPNPDVIVTLKAPPGLAWIGWLLQRIRRCRHVAWETGSISGYSDFVGNTRRRLDPGLLDFPRRRADALIALGDCMKARLLRHQVPEDRIVVAENWADGRIISPMPFPARKPLCILYSGNLGLAHDVATIRGVMERLAGRPDLLFVFAGGGLERRELIDFCREHGITNVSFRSYVRQQDLGASLAECHLGLVHRSPRLSVPLYPVRLMG